MGLTFEKVFTGPFDSIDDVYKWIKWEKRDIEIIDYEKDEVIFSQKDVETPINWSQNAITIVASKYFQENRITGSRESSIHQLVYRVVNEIRRWGVEQRYFTEEDSLVFEKELYYILVNQYASFNSPVWFNIGTEEHPLLSACHINSIEDSMDSIMELATKEAMIFKNGAGSGLNISKLRGKDEKISGGGTASGPISFMRGLDTFARVIRSGGRLRRSAKMIIMDIDHPDILDFIHCKVEEENKARVLLENGYKGGIDGDAYTSVCFQATNHSVSVTDEFMNAVINDKQVSLVSRTDNKKVRIKARELFDEIAKASHQCGDPALIFSSNVNRMNTCSVTESIEACNPCGEFHFLDDMSCNLASINLLKFDSFETRNDIDTFQHIINILITAQDILIDKSRYPTKEIKQNSSDFRPLGLGYSNLGAFIMRNECPYDSDEGRELAAQITAFMTGAAYLQSYELARYKQPFAGFYENDPSVRDVLNQHQENLNRLHETGTFYKRIKSVWNEVVELSLENGPGCRNAQVTLLAPCGTTGLAMDCITTGIEPEMGLVKSKSLVGGGTIETVNPLVEYVLGHYFKGKKLTDSIEYVKENGTLVGFDDESLSEILPIFDCSLEAGGRVISPEGHIKMMAAVQPFLSGAISKTVNMPNSSTIEDIKDIYMKAWKMGLKAIAVYRDGSKTSQPVTTKKKETLVTEPVRSVNSGLKRRRLPDERESITHKFSIAGHEGYLIIGLYPDGSPGELFLRMSKAGSVINGLADSLALAISIALQYGIPLSTYIEKYKHVHFDPVGLTSNPNIPIAKSIVDYVFRWLELKFVKSEEKEEETGILPDAGDSVNDSLVCINCGSFMIRSGSCHYCRTCGESTGCS
jgi:ribonucleoside-diphosphate reductase alpha chain